MADATFTDTELLAYLDEMLRVEEMTAVERAMRNSDALRTRAAGLVRRRDQGAHTVGEIWRRLRLSCPSRSQLGSFLLGTLEENHAEYVEFHLRTIGCRYCAANLADLQRERAESAAHRQTRRQRYFQTSAGYLDRQQR